jgi:hypothetical protein
MACKLFREHKVTSIIIIVILLAIIGIIIPYFWPESFLCKGEFANFGQGIGGIISAISVPLLVGTLILEIKKASEDHSTKIFETHCRSIEHGLLSITNKANTVSGGAAIIKYGDLCRSGTLNIKKTEEELTGDALISVIAALIDLINWIDQPKNSFKFHSFFRVRFMSFIMGFEKMLPEGMLEMSSARILQAYNNDNDVYRLVIAIQRLSQKEHAIWEKYLERQPS